MATGSQKFTAFKMPDGELIDALQRISVTVPQLGQGVVTFQFGDSGDALNVKVSRLQEDAILKEVRTAEAALFHRVSLSGGSFTVTVVRGSGSDEVSVSFPSDHQPETHRTTAIFLAGVHQQLRAYGRTAATDEVLGHELAEFYRQREDLLTKLERTHGEIITSNEVYRERLDARAEARTRDLEAQYEKREESLQTDYKKKVEDLALREQELQKRIAELNDRSSTHERRRVHEEIKRILASRTTSLTSRREPCVSVYLYICCFWH